MPRALTTDGGASRTPRTGAQHTEHGRARYVALPEKFALIKSADEFGAAGMALQQAQEKLTAKRKALDFQLNCIDSYVESHTDAQTLGCAASDLRDMLRTVPARDISARLGAAGKLVAALGALQFEQAAAEAAAQWRRTRYRRWREEQQHTEPGLRLALLRLALASSLMQAPVTAGTQTGLTYLSDLADDLVEVVGAEVESALRFYGVLQVGHHDVHNNVCSVIMCTCTICVHNVHVAFSAQFSPEGLKVVLASLDMTVRVWSAETGDCEQIMKGHTDYVNSAAFSPEGRQIVSGSYDNTVRVWDVATGDCQQTMKGHTGGVNSVSYSTDGTQIVSGSDDNTVRVWDAATGNCQHTMTGHTDEVYSAAFSPEGQKIVSASDDKTVRVWSAVTGDCEQIMKGHTDYVNSAGFSPDGLKVVSASDDMTVRVWSVATGNCEQTMEGHTDAVASAGFSPEGRKIVSASRDKTVRIWNAMTGENQQTLTGHTNWVYSAAFSPDGRLIVSTSEDNTVTVWDATTGE
jgi:uncharacterized protein with WD repeat